MRYIECEEIGKITDLLLLAIGAEREYTESFLEANKEQMRVLVEEEGDLIISILIAHERTWDFYGQSIKSERLIAATLPEYRRKGHMKALFEKNLEDHKKDEVQFVYFYSEEESAMESLGFEKMGMLVTGIFNSEHSDETLFLRPPKAMEEAELADYLTACMEKNKEIYVKRTADDLYDAIDNLAARGGELEKLVDTAGNMMAFCFTIVKDDKVTVSAISSKYGYERQLLNLICIKYQVDTLEVIADSKSKMYNAPWFDCKNYTHYLHAKGLFLDKELHEKIVKECPDYKDKLHFAIEI